jgi:hypothetical protein
MLDMSEDATLDPSVLDKILGEDSTLPPIKPSRPTPKPQAVAPKANPSEANPVETKADDVAMLPEETAPEASPPPSDNAGPMDMMAEIQRKQRERQQRLEQGAPKSGVAPKAVSPQAKTKPSSPPLFKSPSKAASSVPQESEQETQDSPAPVSKAPIVPKASEAPAPLVTTPIAPKAQEALAPLVKTIANIPEVPHDSTPSQAPSLFKAPSVPPKSLSTPVEPNSTPDSTPTPAKAPDAGPKKAPPVPKPKGKASMRDRLVKRREAVEDVDSDHSDF